MLKIIVIIVIIIIIIIIIVIVIVIVYPDRAGTGLCSTASYSAAADLLRVGRPGQGSLYSGVGTRTTTHHNTTELPTTPHHATPLNCWRSWVPSLPQSGPLQGIIVLTPAPIISGARVDHSAPPQHRQDIKT